MARFNGTFSYRNPQNPTVDLTTGFISAPATTAEWISGGKCQIDKTTDRQLSGEDGRVYNMYYTVFIPKPFSGSLDIGTEVSLSMEDGTVDKFIVEHVDNLNRRYIEIGN